MIHGVLALADRRSPPIMMPRPDVYWIDLDDKPETIEREIADCPYSRIVVARDGDLGRPLGVVQKKDLVGDLIAGQGIQRRAADRADLRAGDHAGAAAAGDLQGLAAHRLRRRRVRRLPRHRHAERRAGRHRRRSPEEHEQPSENIMRRADGSWLVDGRASIIDLDRKARPAGDRRRIPHRRRACARTAGAYSGRVRDLRNSTAGASKSSTWTASGSTSCCSVPMPQTADG